jgi:uncharacterized protein YegL
MLGEQLKTPPMPERSLPPVLILISDSQPTDDISRGLKAIMEQPWGKKAVRLATAIGEKTDKDIFQKFIAHSEIKPLEARNPQALTQFIKWGSTSTISWLSSPPVSNNKISSSMPPVPVPTPTNDNAEDIW